jgi:hypothetical protein
MACVLQPAAAATGYVVVDVTDCVIGFVSTSFLSAVYLILRGDVEMSDFVAFRQTEQLDRRGRAARILGQRVLRLHAHGQLAHLFGDLDL